MATKYRAEQVGSFLRPLHVRRAHNAHAQGQLSLEELRKIEDEAILKLLQMQKEVGIDVYSDGEMRRGGWASEFSANVNGYVEGRPSVRLQFHENPLAEAWREAHPEEADVGQAAPAGGAPAAARGVLGAPLSLKRRLTAHESGFLKQHSPGPFKITMPAASYIVARGYNPEISDRQFGNRAGVLRAVAETIRSEIRALVAEGVTYIQLDNPHYPDYVVDERREQWRAIGIDPDQAIKEDVEADNSCLEGIDRSRLTIGMHFCRGNGGLGGWHTSGGYDRIAEDVFGRLAVDTLLLEYDSDRAGTFEPLRHVPRDKTVVLGLVTTKSGQLEPEDLLRRRIDEAARYIPAENLALSPQCGFASTFVGNPLSEEEQRRKLQLVVDTARKVWG
jgi:5-methyltetrahydropteroyltriglutamate--homocysteine methyltransferase